MVWLKDDKPVLLLIHGFAQSPQSWDQIVALLGERYCTIALDLQAMISEGGSTSVPTPESVVAATIAQLERRGIGQVAVWGYSLGARIALTLALNHPDRVNRLILESGSAGIEDKTARSDRSAADRELADRIERGSIEQFVDAWERLPIFAGQPEALVAAQRPSRLANNPAALAAALRGLGQGSFAPVWDRLAEVSAPTLVLSGERDAAYTEIGKRLAAALSDGKHTVVVNAGHAVHLEQPQVACAAVRSLLE